MNPLKHPPRKTEPHAQFTPNSARAVELVLQLMAIPGRSGQEQPVVDFLRQQLEQAGLRREQLLTDTAHRRSPLSGQVGNLVVKLRGNLRSPRRLLSAHMDTVPICVGSRPVRSSRVVRSADPRTGLGADNRAGCAVLLNTLLEIVEHQLPHPPLTFCWFVQEEVGLMGSHYASTSLLGHPRYGFNFDGGSCAKLTVGATGGYRLGVEVQGLAAHAGGSPEQGISAIAIAAIAIADLHRGGWHGNIQKGGRHGTSNVGQINGGEATNVVTDRVVLKAEARSHDPDFRQRIVHEIEESFRKAAREVKNADGECGNVAFIGRLDYESFLLTPDEPCVRTAEAAVRATGRQPERAITNGGLDANWLVRHGIPTVSLGCGQRDQHMKSETLNLDDFEGACQIALRLATAREA